MQISTRGFIVVELSLAARLTRILTFLHVLISQRHVHLSREQPILIYLRRGVFVCPGGQLWGSFFVRVSKRKGFLFSFVDPEQNNGQSIREWKSRIWDVF